MVRQVVAMKIMAPSMTIKSVSSDVKSVLLKPPASSTQRYILLVKIVMEEAKRPELLLERNTLYCTRKLTEKERLEELRVHQVNVSWVPHPFAFPDPNSEFSAAGGE